MEGATLAAGLSLLIASAAVVLASISRRAKQLGRDQELSASIDALRAHYSALRRLDDDATPLSMLKFVKEVSEIIHSEQAIYVISRLLKADPHAFENPRPIQNLELQSALAWCACNRPDLKAAFEEALTTAMLALVLQRPDCGGAFPNVVIDVVRDPTEEATRVIEAARTTGPLGGQPHPLAA
ncbi:MAG TPA: hypothetical protein VM780_02420 [Hansschlegelia sp.]|nr:hypothetical protein [Hansschlegelia sp.]